jgi:uncharacterized membrane protein (DUF2068 family)
VTVPAAPETLVQAVSNPAHDQMPDRRKRPATRPLGLRVIIGYKLAKAPLMLALALWLTVDPRSAIYVADAIVRISERGVTLSRLGFWIHEHLTRKLAMDVAILALVDGAWTAAEGFLLLQGRAWGEWVVVAGLTALVPVEAVSLERNPSLFKLAVVAVNSAIVAYLVFRRLSPRVLGKK